MSPQESISHYKIIGEGGMGAAYRATESKLNRKAAYQSAAARVWGRLRHMQRFEREAKVRASLSHPERRADLPDRERRARG